MYIASTLIIDTFDSTRKLITLFWNNMIIHINGWPGVGKKTIGEIVAKEINARFIHNHVLHDVAWACAGRGDEEYWPLYERVQSEAYKVLARRPSEENFVMTNALCKTADREILAWEHVVALAIKRNVPLIPIVLKASINVLVERVTHPDRLTTKLTDPEYLTQMLTKHELLVPRVDDTFLIDVDELSAEDVASSIIKYLSEGLESRRVATEQLLQFV